MIVILDGNSIAYRAFHKAPPLSAPDGTPTGAVHIFFTIVERVRAQLKPSAVLAVFDAPGVNFRKEIYPAYKATRDAMPEDLAVQMALIHKLLPLAGIPVYKKAGVEADDIIATLARQSTEPVTIVTKDKDLFQLVNDDIKIFDDQSGNLLGIEETAAKYGVKPVQILSYLSLIGDKSDNIPGVNGIGEKTASKLIAEYGSLDGIYANIDAQKGKLKENLITGKEDAYLAMKLVELQTIEPFFEPDLTEDTEALKQELARLGMRTAASKLLAKHGLYPENTESTEEAAVLNLPAYTFGKVDNARMYLASDNGMWVAGDGVYDQFNGMRDSNIKSFYDVKEFAKSAGTLGNVQDYMLISWLCEPDNGTIRKAKAESMEQFVPRLVHLSKELDNKLNELALSSLYANVELPIAYILAKMENTGIKVDPARVRSVANILKKEIAVVATKVMNAAGFEINLNSPKQLAELLYDILKIPQLSKTKRSTGEDVLKELFATAPEHRELLENILSYREYSKLLSTYTQPLIDAIAEDGRIHTTFKQTGTATGRLSSANPNLQNIPAREGVGKTIRTAFVPEDGYVFISIDYSQIELRVLAHMSKDPTLKEAFEQRQDIHTITAMKIFAKTAAEINPDLRRLAKAVNFGILYGLSPYGLSRDTGVTPREAKEFINAYFGLYSKVRDFIDDTIENTKIKGYCETVLGRKRFFPDINSRNNVIRNRAERAAMNAPIQGSAADIIKLAMLHCDNIITNQGFDARMVLQIHDELLFEVREDQADAFLVPIKEAMQHAFPLDVPLDVNCNIGDSWGDLK